MNNSASAFGKAAVETVSFLKCQMYCLDVRRIFVLFFRFFFSAPNFFATQFYRWHPPIAQNISFCSMEDENVFSRTRCGAVSDVVVVIIVKCRGYAGVEEGYVV